MGFIYLASPYTPLNGESIKKRVTQVCKIAAKLMQKGFNVFSPIVHSHYIADHLEDRLRFDHEFWMKQDLAILEKCSHLYVLMLEGWEKSKGVTREIKKAKRLKIPVVYISYEGLMKDVPMLRNTRNALRNRMGLGGEVVQY